MSWVRMPATVRAGMRGKRIVVEVELLFVHAEHVPAVEGVGHLLRHGAEILADDRHAGRRRRRGDHGEDLLARVVHVHAVFGREPVGHPPQPMHGHRVVDPQDVGVATHAEIS